MSAIQSNISLRKKHFLFITYPLFGHVIPLLQLAKKISQFHCVSIVVSVGIKNDIYERHLLSSSDNNINVIGLDDGFNGNLDTFTAMPMEIANQLINAMKPGIQSLLDFLPTFLPTDIIPIQSPIKEPVDIIIADRSLTLLCASTCHSRRIPFCPFTTSAGIPIADGLEVNEETAITNDIFSDSSHPLTESLKQYILNGNGDIDLVNGLIFNFSRSCDRGNVIKKMTSHPKTRHIPLFCIGPSDGQYQLTNSELSIKNWLDQKEEKSVIYVSFGTIASLGPEQTGIMFKALLTTGKHFIFKLSSAMQALLPEEIQMRIEKQLDFDTGYSSFLCLTWAPQRLILRHVATGVFLTHGGWNSTLEGIICGVPMVAWPMMVDQYGNSRWMAEKGIGIMIPDTKANGGRIVSAEEIIATLTRAETCRESVIQMAKKVNENGNSDFLKLMNFDFSFTYTYHAGRHDKNGE